MKVINISADRIAVWGCGDPVFLGRNGIDVELGRVLVALDKEFSFDKIAVLNGPGGFTNLRVGTLALNLLKVLKGGKLNLFTISKIALYKKAVTFGFLPPLGVIYIGQKSNVWLWDFEKDVLISTIRKDTLAALDLERKKYFVDQVYDPDYFPKDRQIGYLFDEEGCSITYLGNCYRLSWEDLDLLEVDTVTPNYMIDPNIH